MASYSKKAEKERRWNTISPLYSRNHGSLKDLGTQRVKRRRTDGGRMQLSLATASSVSASSSSSSSTGSSSSPSTSSPSAIDSHESPSSSSSTSSRSANSDRLELKFSSSSMGSESISNDDDPHPQRPESSESIPIRFVKKPPRLAPSSSSSPSKQPIGQPLISLLASMTPNGPRIGNFFVKAISDPVLQINRLYLDGTRLKVATILVADSSGCMEVHLKDEQIPAMEKGSLYVLRNASLQMNRCKSYLKIDIWGLIQPVISHHPTFVSNLQNLISEVEWELIRE